MQAYSGKLAEVQQQQMNERQHSSPRESQDNKVWLTSPVQTISLKKADWPKAGFLIQSLSFDLLLILI